MRRLLYDEKETQVNEFVFKINHGNELRSKDFSDKTIKITFKNKKLSGVEHNIRHAEVDPRGYWLLMRSIADEIDRITETMEAAQCLSAP